MPFDGSDYSSWPPPRPSPHPLRTLVVAIFLIALVPLLLLAAIIQAVALIISTVRRRRT